MKKWYEGGNDCRTCMGHKMCEQWCNSIDTNGNINLRECKDGESYANKEQVEAMIQWCEEKAKAKSVSEFQVDDKVFSLMHGNGVIEKILIAGSYPIAISFSKGKVGVRSIDGKFSINDIGRDLYHGHDLEVIIKEKLPVRIKTTHETWVVLWFDKNNGEAYGRKCEGSQSKEEAQKTYDFYKDHGKKPVMVEVPE